MEIVFRYMRWLATLPQYVGFILLLSCLVISELVWYLLRNYDYGRELSIFIIVIFYLGLPAVTSIALKYYFGEAIRVNIYIVLSAFFVTVILNIFAEPIFLAVEGEFSLVQSAAVALWVCGIFAPLYIFWVAARALVEVEEGKRVRADRCIGTFLAFLFLIIGIFFIQPRVRRVFKAVDPVSSVAGR